MEIEHESPPWKEWDEVPEEAKSSLLSSGERGTGSGSSLYPASSRLSVEAGAGALPDVSGAEPALTLPKGPGR